MTNSLVTTTETKTITSLEVAEMLSIKHRDVLNKLCGTIDKSGKVKQIGIIPVLTEANFRLSDYFIPSTYKDGSGKENKCYLITKMGCEFLANKFTGEKGILFTAKYVKRFNDMEDALKNNPFNLPTTYKEALVQLLETVEENERLSIENAEMKPKAEFHDSVATSVNSISFGDFAGVYQNQNNVKFGRNKIMEWCRKKDYLCSSFTLKNKPTQRMIDSGYMEYKESVNERNGNLYTSYTPLLTGKGQIWLTKELNKYLNVA